MSGYVDDTRPTRDGCLSDVSEWIEETTVDMNHRDISDNDVRYLSANTRLGVDGVISNRVELESKMDAIDAVQFSTYNTLFYCILCIMCVAVTGATDSVCPHCNSAAYPSWEGQTGVSFHEATY